MCQSLLGDVENGAFAAVPNVQDVPPPVNAPVNVQDRMNDRVDELGGNIFSLFSFVVYTLSSISFVAYQLENFVCPFFFL